MIDRAARINIAEILRHFIAGQVININFQDAEAATEDLAVPAIWESLWPFYCDYRSEPIKPEWVKTSFDKERIANWLLFLYSEEEYRWPIISYPGARPFSYGLIARWLGKHKQQEKFMAIGDYSVWPFIDKKSFLRAKNNPVLLEIY